MDNRWSIIKNNVISISRETVEDILYNEIGKTKDSSRWVSQLVKPDQKHAGSCHGKIWRYLKKILGRLGPETFQAMETPPPHLLRKKVKAVSFAGPDYQWLQVAEAVATKTKCPGKLMKVVSFRQNNAPVHKSLLSMAVGYDCEFVPVVHDPVCLIQLILLLTGWKLLHRWDSGSTTAMEEVCGPLEYAEKSHSTRASGSTDKLFSWPPYVKGFDYAWSWSDH